MNEYKVDESRITIIPNGVDTERFNPGGKSWQGPPKVLIASRFDPRKNLTEAFDALAPMRELPYELAVIGDGPQRKALEAKAKKLEHHVSFPGTVPRDELERNFSFCNVYLSTSSSEGFGLSVLQAMAAGCAVLVSDIRGHREMITNEVDGLMYGTHEELLGHLRELLTNPDLAGRLGEAARKKSLEYSWRTIAEATLEVYRRATRGNTSQE
jgi:glycosyltransferase involved in cell wall biosynthesis